MRRTLSVLALMLCCTLPASTAVIRVPADQPTIQAGIIAAAAGDMVVVADGIFTGTGNRNIQFLGKAITVRSENGYANCIIDCESEEWGQRHRGFWIHEGEGAGSVIEGFTIRNGIAAYGGAIYCEGSSPTITGNLIIDNIASSPWDGASGGGICCRDGSPLVTGNIITGNEAGAVMMDFVSGSGGGISCINSSAMIEKNLIADNYATGLNYGDGGGIYIFGGSTVISSCTFTENDAFGGHYFGDGGALCCSGASVTVVDTIFWHDEAIGYGDEICLRNGSSLTISWSDVEGGQEAVWSTGSTGHWGVGMIDVDPLFIPGPLGDFYLGQIDAGQSQDSPCVDAGDPSSAMVAGTTRTDAVQDSGVVDIGFHYPLVGGGETHPDTFILSGPWGTETSPVFTFIFTGTDFADPPEALEYSWKMDEEGWSAYGPSTWVTFTEPAEGEHLFQVRARDTDGLVDPYPAAQDFIWLPWEVPSNWIRMVTGPGPGRFNPPLVRTPQAEWLAYGAGGYGVNVACGDLDGDGVGEVVTGPGPGRIYGPHVRGWTMDGTPLANVNFMAYGTHRYGVNVGAANLDGTGPDEIITGAGPGPVFGPHVRGWTVTGGGCQPMPGASYFAYGTPKWGVNITGGDVNGDGRDEVITGAGPGPVYGAHVRGWIYEDGTMVPAPGLSFFAYGTPKWGVNVGCGDIDGDGIDEIITGPGPGPVFRDHIRAFDYNGSGVSQVPGVSFFASGSWNYYGVVISAADVDDDGIDEILSVNGAGPDEAAVIYAWNADGGTVSYVPGSLELAYGEWMNYGGKVAGVRND